MNSGFIVKVGIKFDRANDSASVGDKIKNSPSMMMESNCQEYIQS